MQKDQASKLNKEIKRLKALRTWAVSKGHAGVVSYYSNLIISVSLELKKVGM